MGDHHHLGGVIAETSSAINCANGRYYCSFDEYLEKLTDAAVANQSLPSPPVMTPISTLLETRVALLEKAEKAVVMASGMAAITASILAVAHFGNHIIAHTHVHGTTEILLTEYLPALGIRVSRVNFKDEESLRQTMTAQTKLLFIEMPSNPFLEVLDIPIYARLAHENGAILVVDHSLASPVLINPLSLGADLVVGSSTAYLGGQGHNLFGYVAGAREAVLEVANYSWVFGATLPQRQSAFVLQNLPTLSMRMEKQSQNALEVSYFLSKHAKIDKVFYPGLKSHPDYKTSKKFFSVFGGIATFRLKSDLEGTGRFLNNLRLCSLSPILGEEITSLEHPASMTYLGVSQKSKDALGVTTNLVRISVGLESVETILRDLEQALRRV